MRNRLRELREGRGLTQEELARALGVTRQTIIAIEKGRYDPPSLRLAFRIARFFGGVKIEEVFIYGVKGGMNAKKAVGGVLLYLGGGIALGVTVPFMAETAGIDVLLLAGLGLVIIGSLLLGFAHEFGGDSNYRDAWIALSSGGVGGIAIIGGYSRIWSLFLFGLVLATLGVAFHKIRGGLGMSLVEVLNLEKDYGRVKALKGISFTIEEGEVFGLIGRTGGLERARR